MGEDLRIKISKRSVDGVQLSPKRQLIMDKELPGFGLRVEPNGLKTYFVRYRANGGGRRAPQRMMTIGRHGPLTADEARKEAKRLLGAVAKGDDPVGDKNAIREEMTVAELVTLYESEGCFVQRGIRQGQPMTPNTKQFTLARIYNHVVPLLGKRRVSEIGPGDIERFAAAVRSRRTARDETIEPAAGQKARRIIVRGGEGAARKVVRDLSAVLSFAKRRGIVQINAVQSAAVCKTDGRRERYLSVLELQRLGTAVRELEAEGLSPKAANIVRLLALTGCRRDEIAGLKWTEVDLEAGVLRLEQTKTGRSIRPLSAAASDVIASIPPEGGSPYVFPANGSAGYYGGTKRYWPKILERAKLGTEVTPHVLRHSFGSLIASSGESLLMVGALLGHANARSSSLYAHVSANPAISAANRVSEEIRLALGVQSVTATAI